MVLVWCGVVWGGVWVRKEKAKKEKKRGKEEKRKRGKDKEKQLLPYLEQYAERHPMQE
jgi:hypothetical protein